MTETPTPSRRQRVFIIAIIVLIFGAILGGAFALTQKFLEDRDRAMRFDRQKLPKRVETGPQREVRHYTAEELEEARKKGELPKGFPLPQTAPNQSNLDAVQRSLRTVDEINRINEQNRRIMEQNQRINNR